VECIEAGGDKMKPEPLNGKYKEYAVELWWDCLANERLSTEGSEVLNNVKSAVEFYLKYKDIKGMKELLMSSDIGEVNLTKRERKELGEIYSDFMKLNEEMDKEGIEVLEKEYNDWLFSITFKDVLEDGKN